MKVWSEFDLEYHYWWWREGNGAWGQIAGIVWSITDVHSIAGAKIDFEKAAFIYEIQARRVTHGAHFPPKWRFKQPFIELTRDQMLQLKGEFPNNNFGHDNRKFLARKRPEENNLVTFEDYALDPSNTSRSEALRTLAQYMDGQMNLKKLAWGKTPVTVKKGKSSRGTPWHVIEDADRIVTKIPLGKDAESRVQAAKVTILRYSKVKSKNYSGTQL